MVKLFAASLALAASLAAFAPAHADGGCGFGFHRGPYGGCRANGVGVPRAGVVIAVPGAVIYAPLGRACPYGYHLGPQGRRCWAN